MNIIVWNCRGAFKPSFQKHVGEPVWNHNPAMLVVMETRVKSSRAKEISDRLPFDGSVHTDTIGYAGGLWLLWDSDKMDVMPLANTEQEIHAIVKYETLILASSLLPCMLVLELLKELFCGIILLKLLSCMICLGFWRVISMNHLRRRINSGEE